MTAQPTVSSVNLRNALVLCCAFLVGAATVFATAALSFAHEMPGTHVVRVYKTISETDDAGIPHEGVSFRLRQISDVDPTTPAGQKYISEMDLRAAIRMPTVGEEYFAKTMQENGQAVATFKNLRSGLYVVEELPHRQGDVLFTVTEPFVIAVPSNGYSPVEVRTKHQPQIFIKHVDAETIIPGAVFRYALDANVPLPDAANRLYRFMFVDELVDEQTIAAVTVHAYQSAALNTTTTDFDDRFEAGVLLSHSVRTYGSHVVIELDRTGLETLAQLRSHNPFITVRATLTVKAADWYPEGHVLTNKAYLYTDGRNPEHDIDFDRAVASNQVQVKVVHTPPEETPPLGEGDDNPGPSGGAAQHNSAKKLRSALAYTGPELTAVIGFGILFLVLGWHLSREHRNRFVRDNI